MAAEGKFIDWFRQPANLQRLARWGLLLFFVWLTGRFWHPYYGFTRFIQLDDAAAAVMLPELRDAPVYVYHDTGGYDGVGYAQLAVHPLVRDPGLARAVDTLPYRARRILLSWVAYLLGTGDAARIVQVYAALNLVVWFALALLLAKLFPPLGWRNLIAWAGLLFSAGVLHSVRLALTDLAALALLAWASWLAGRSRPGAAAGLLGAAGLVRETALLGAVALVPAAWRQKPGATLGRLVLTALPLALWLLYLKKVTLPVVTGLGNLDWPLHGWFWKISTTLPPLGREPDWLGLTTLLAFAGLTVQLLYVVLRPEPRDLWWRLGAVYGGLMLCLSPAVWVGHPGAATRILLPLSLAFNVCAVRNRAATAWLVAGNLSIFSGVLALWHVPSHENEVAAGRATPGSYVVQLDPHWYRPESGGGNRWIWCAAKGGLDLDFWPRASGPVTIRLAVRGFTPRPLEIRQAGRTLWSGTVGEMLRRIELSAAMVKGHTRLELASPAPPTKEGPEPGARGLGFALYGITVD